MITLNDVRVVARAKGGAVVFDGMLSAFPADIIAQAAAYAIHKKAQDASGGDGLTGDTALSAARDVILALKAGTWAKRGGGGPRARDEASFVESKVLAKVKATIKAAKASMPDNAALAARVAKIVASDKHKAWIDALKAEYAAKQVGSDLDLDL